MHIICLRPLERGVYNDHSTESIVMPPDGWAYIPDDFPLPSTFPRLGSVEAKLMPYTAEGEDGETVTYMMMTVTAMTEGTLPEPQPEPIAEPTAEELLNAMLGVSRYE